jgi:glycosyltransferase involved in cell wall biosynthesis
VAGQTHPKVRARSGEQYRESLRDRARRLGVDAMIRFDDAYRTSAELADLALGARAVVLPYESTDQVTSGVLVDALAAGRPVIATAFPHALELLGGGAGIVVSHGDPVGMARAMRRLAADTVARDMAARAHRIGARHSWDLVARDYAELAVAPAHHGVTEPVRLATGA